MHEPAENLNHMEVLFYMDYSPPRKHRDRRRFLRYLKHTHNDPYLKYKLKRLMLEMDGEECDSVDKRPYTMTFHQAEITHRHCQ